MSSSEGASVKNLDLTSGDAAMYLSGKIEAFSDNANLTVNENSSQNFSDLYN